MDAEVHRLALAEPATMRAKRSQQLFAPWRSDCLLISHVVPILHYLSFCVGFVPLGYLVSEDSRLPARIARLAVTALKYSPADTPIELTLGVSADRREAIIGVRDHGPGIPVNERALLFEQFKRLSTAGETRGSGLGLYICKRIIEDHGGTLEAEWPSGGGTRFVFTVPVAAEALSLPPKSHGATTSR